MNSVLTLMNLCVFSVFILHTVHQCFIGQKISIVIPVCVHLFVLYLFELMQSDPIVRAISSNLH